MCVSPTLQPPKRLEGKEIGKDFEILKLFLEKSRTILELIAQMDIIF